MSNIFPDRKSIKPKIKIEEIDHSSLYSAFPDRESISSQNKIIEDDGFNRDLQISLLEKQKEFLWTRVYLKEEVDIDSEDTLKIKYLESNEELELQFICYNKKGLDKDSGETIIDYNSEDDKKVLCLKVDLKVIDFESEHIPFIRTLFKKSKWFQYQTFRKDDLIIEYKGNKLEYIFIDF